MPTWFALAALATALLTGGIAPQSATATWNGKQWSVDELREQAPAAAGTVAAWMRFAEDAGYRVVLSDDRQVVLVLNERYSRRRPRSERAEVKKLLEALDATAAVVDPLLGPVGDGSAPVVLVAALEQDYPRLLAHVATLDPRLAGWARGGGLAATGFVLSEPLVSAWLDEGSGQEEWERHNELVHRAAQLLLRRRAPQLPPWFALGFGWHVEEAVLGSIYCFPHRAGFVWASEHGGWEKALATAFKPPRRRDDGVPAELTIDEFADWDPMDDGREFDSAKADVAFGVVRYLARAHPDAVGRVAHAFDEKIRAGWKVTISATEWTTDPGYRLPAARQLEVLQTVDPEFLQNATAAFVNRKLGVRRKAGRRP